jgi:ABC-type amino acid transport substrate-binding protein
MKDPNTGKLSGLFYDYTEALGQALHLKIEWTEEMNWGDFPAALNSGRIDAMCGGSWPNAARARVIDFVRPILYAPTYAWVRTDDKRFDNNIEAINDPGVSIVVIEGSTPAVIATQDFPKAKLIQLPAITSLAEGFVSLADGKADVTIQSASAEHQYDVNNPGKIRRIEAKMPLRLGAQCMAIAGGQDRLRRMLDLATDEMITSGQVEKIIAQYDDVPGAILRVAPSYKTDAVK